MPGALQFLDAIYLVLRQYLGADAFYSYLGRHGVGGALRPDGDAALAVAQDGVEGEIAQGRPAQAAEQDAPEVGTPVRIRQKAFPATPMSVDEAVDAMELVGHDFFLFQNAETGVPSVVYRRRGWSYGVIRLDESLPQDHVSASEGERAYQARED